MDISDNKRIAKNTGMLYFRMFLTLCVSLYTTRVVLNILGVEDFGIYNVVGGVVGMFIFLNSSMAAASSRFLIVELAKNDVNELKRVFNASLSSHFFIVVIIFLLSETIGLWFLTNKLVIPIERINAAKWVYQFSVLSALVSLTQIPYNATIIAHEKMSVYGYVTIVEVILRLLIVYFLSLGDFDKLKVYSVLYFFVTLIISTIYRLYCQCNFNECEISFQWDKALYKKLFSFSIWELYGGLALMGMTQGLNMLLNIFFGPIVNAARGVAYMVQGAIVGFGDSFITAVKPKIIKMYVEKNFKKMMEFVFVSSKYSFYLTLLFSLPLYIETPFILELWLKIVPNHTVSFCRLILINNLVWSLRNPIVTAFHAIGKIKVANLVCGSLFYLIIIFSYLCLKIGFPPESVFIVTIFFSVLIQVTELILLKKLISFSVKTYFKEVIFISILVLIIAAIVPFFVSIIFEQGILRFLIVGFSSVIALFFTIFYIGIAKKDKNLIVSKIHIVIKKYKNGINFN